MFAAASQSAKRWTIPPRKKKQPSLDEARAAIDPKLREQILDVLLSKEIEGFQDFVTTVQGVIAHVLVGDIPPERAEVLTKYFELLFTAVSAHALTDGEGGGKVTADAVAKARAASRARLESRVDLEQGPNGLQVNLDIVEAQ